MKDTEALFAPGQLVHHLRFDYRGVIINLDPVFSLTKEWYEMMARSRPPKDEPWYHVLVHDSDHQTYVAQRNLEMDSLRKPINNPLVPDYFKAFHDGVYILHENPS